MTEQEKQKLFGIRCRAASGGDFHPQDYDFCEEMRRLHREEYKAMTKEILDKRGYLKIDGRK